MRLSLILSVFLLLAPPAFAEQDAASTPAPQWYLDEIAFLTRDGGRWVASNAEYKGENEPYESYVVEWKAGHAHAITGKLFGLLDGEETGAFWEFHQYWHPGRGEAILEQFGRRDQIGVGPITKADKKTRVEQIFYSPDGSANVLGHLTENTDGDTQLTESFDIVDGEWRPRRIYTWKRDSPGQPDARDE